MTEHFRITRNRREFLRDACGGFGGLAFGAMLAAEQARAQSANPLAPKRPHIPAKAKSVIFLFLSGGPSHMETFDPKPLLNKLHGEKRPAGFGEAKYQFVSPDARLLGTKRTFKRYGKSGIEVSDLFPHLAQRVDDMAVIRSCHGDMVVHSAAQYQLFTGRVIPGFPSMGSWVIYGLGSEAESLPAYVVLPDPHGAQEAGMPMYANGFLPAVYQPTMFRPGDRPVLNLDLPKGVSLDERRKTLGGKTQLLFTLVKRIARVRDFLEQQSDGGRIAPFDDFLPAEKNLADIAGKAHDGEDDVGVLRDRFRAIDDLRTKFDQWLSLIFAAIVDRG